MKLIPALLTFAPIKDFLDEKCKTPYANVKYLTTSVILKVSFTLTFAILFKFLEI